jgi:3-hydroxymyristoyl/3-hydroxydecanoyl-(acyl carrier protein) dehydratase
VSFYFVDRIFDIESGKSAQGIKNVTKSESYLYATPRLGRFINPAIISEAVMQLTSWLIVYSSDFKKKPVVLRIDQCDYLDLVRPGDQIYMEVKIEEYEENIYLAQGTAKVADKLVLKATDCHAMAMDITDFNDPEAVRKQFASIHRPEFKDVSRVANKETVTIPNNITCQFYAVDKIQAVHTDRKIQSLKQYTLAEDFFKDHFPRKPVVPAVLQVTSVGETAQALVSHLNPKATLNPKRIENGRLRKFISPGSECLTTVEIVSGDVTQDGSEIVVKGFIECEGQKMMQTTIIFENCIE